MGAIAAVRLRGGPGLFDGSMPARQECDPETARITLELGAPDARVRVVVTCLRDRDVILLDISDARPEPTPWAISVENWHEGDRTAAVDGRMLETTHVNASSYYAECNRKVGVDTAALGLRDPLLGRAWGLWIDAGADGAAAAETIRLPPAARRRVVIATVCAAPADGLDALAEATVRGRRLAATAPETLAIWDTEHRAWWRAFWQRSWISLHSESGDAEYEERLWHVNLYAMACGMGGAYPMRFNGGSFLMDKDTRKWDGGYWGQNMRLVYFPMLAAGHFAFVREYIDWYLGNQPFARAQTRATFGIDALTWAEVQSFWGFGLSITAGTDMMMVNHFTNNLEFCLIMEGYYRATGDEAFLRDDFYPALRGVLEFFRHYAKEGDDGRLHIEPAAAVETWVELRDPQSEVCGLHHFLPRAIAWAERFGEPAEFVAHWRVFADKLPEIPIGRWHVESTYWHGIHDKCSLLRCELGADGIYLPGADKTREKTSRLNMENPELYIAFPWGQVNLDSPEEDRRRFENTWNHRTWRFQNSGWAQDAVQMARLGWRADFHQALREHANYHQRFPNGLFISPATPHFHGLLTEVPYFDTAGVHLTALEEMFLQSYDGVLKLAPAVPECWSGSCRLHALGGFIVELRVCHGLPVRTTITATRGGESLRVRNHRWETLRATSTRGAGQTVASGGICEYAPADGEVIELVWDGVEPAAPLPAAAPPQIVWPDCKCRGPLAAYRSGHWHDERKNHGQVGLAADGLFPATRRPPGRAER
jgi:hypothetical protein